MRKKKFLPAVKKKKNYRVVFSERVQLKYADDEISDKSIASSTESSCIQTAEANTSILYGCMGDLENDHVEDSSPLADSQHVISADFTDNVSQLKSPVEIESNSSTPSSPQIFSKGFTITEEDDESEFSEFLEQRYFIEKKENGIMI